MWAMQYLLTDRPRNSSPGGLGTMATHPAPSARRPPAEATVVCVDGDGCFQMTAQS